MKPRVFDLWEANVVHDWSIADGYIFCASWRYLAEDKSFGANWQKALELGKPRAAYYAQFFGLFAPSGRQANNFTTILKKYDGVQSTDKLWIDAELTGISIKSILDFAYNVEDKVGIRPGIYSRTELMNKLVFRNLTSAQLEDIHSMLGWDAGYLGGDGAYENPDNYIVIPSWYQFDNSRYGKTVQWQLAGDVSPENAGIAGKIDGAIDINWVDDDFWAEWSKGVVPAIPTPTPIPAPTQPIVLWQGKVVSPLGLNIRNGAGTSFPKIGAVPYGTTVSIYEVRNVGSDVWIRIDPTQQNWIANLYQGNSYIKTI